VAWFDPITTLHDFCAQVLEHDDDDRRSRNGDL
jgi:hypothetical protein